MTATSKIIVQTYSCILCWLSMFELSRFQDIDFGYSLLLCQYHLHFWPLISYSFWSSLCLVYYFLSILLRTCLHLNACVWYITCPYFLLVWYLLTILKIFCNCIWPKCHNFKHFNDLIRAVIFHFSNKVSYMPVENKL